MRLQLLLMQDLCRFLYRLWGCIHKFSLIDGRQMCLYGKLSSHSKLEYLHLELRFCLDIKHQQLILVTQKFIGNVNFLF